MFTPKQLAVAELPPEGTSSFVVTLASHYPFLFKRPMFLSCDLLADSLSLFRPLSPHSPSFFLTARRPLSPVTLSSRRWTFSSSSVESLCQFVAALISELVRRLLTLMTVSLHPLRPRSQFFYLHTVSPLSLTRSSFSYSARLKRESGPRQFPLQNEGGDFTQFHFWV